MPRQALVRLKEKSTCFVSGFIFLPKFKSLLVVYSDGQVRTKKTKRVNISSLWGGILRANGYEISYL